MQDSLASLEDAWSFPAANLLPRINLWPRPTAASAHGGNRRDVWMFGPRFGCFLCKLKHESWLLLSVAVRWFWSCGRDRTERPKLDEASLCPYSLSKASTTTRSSAHPPRHTRSRIPAQTLTQLYRCLAQHSHCILLRKKVHAEKCLFDRHWVYSVKAHLCTFVHPWIGAPLKIF